MTETTEIRRTAPFSLMYVLSDTAWKILCHALYRGPEFALYPTEVVNTFHKFKGYSFHPVRKAFRELKGYKLLVMESNHYNVNYAELETWWKKPVELPQGGSDLANPCRISKGDRNQQALAKSKGTRNSNNTLSNKEVQVLKNVLNREGGSESDNLPVKPSEASSEPKASASLKSEASPFDPKAFARKVKEDADAMEKQLLTSGVPKHQVDRRISDFVMKAFYNDKARAKVGKPSMGFDALQ